MQEAIWWLAFGWILLSLTGLSMLVYGKYQIETFSDLITALIYVLAGFNLMVIGGAVFVFGAYIVYGKEEAIRIIKFMV